MTSSESAEPPLEFFVDRSVGRRTVAGLRELGHIVHLVTEVFANDAQDTDDQTWIDEFHHPDLYQMLAYCTVLGLKHGHLVYARGRSSAGSGPDAVRVSGSEVVIHRHTLDLSEPPDLLLRQVARIADRIRDGCVGWLLRK